MRKILLRLAVVLTLMGGGVAAVASPALADQIGQAPTASNITGLQSNTPVEVLETEYPIELVQYGYVQDSGGPGRFRGGLGLVREYRYVAERGTLQMRADRVKFAEERPDRGGETAEEDWLL